MVENGRNVRVVDKLKKIISKYYEIEVYREEDYSFEPTCIIKVTAPKPAEHFRQMHLEFKKIGFQAKFHALKKDELKEHKLETRDDIKWFSVSFEAKEFEKDIAKTKRNKIIQVILLVTTIILVIVSAWVYDTYFDPFYSGFWALFSFCLGMFLIIIVHEFGHVFLSRFHKLDASLPYLIPGPPPIGMLGAFVSIRDDPQTRNQKFDVAFGGIILGIIISIILVIVGLLLSVQMDMSSYLQLRVDFFGGSLAEEAEFVHEHLNSYNLLFLGFRFLFFDKAAYATYYGFNLPQSVVLIHPLAFTGWLGLLISGLNLVPISFLDGGHIFKAVFPYRFIKLIGLGIGCLIFLFLNPYLLWFAFIGLPGAVMDLNPEIKSENIPNPIVPLTKSRKIYAACIIGIFILLFPLTFNNLFFGFGF
ncbi:MAG: site-2 protease family protein [Candidatus Helarchaeota archaeon]|nr:site-2 protease family protein [Candidatus Helarchaeota archaeon]